MDKKMETLVMADEYMYNLQNGIRVIVEKFEEDNPSEGYKLIDIMCEGIEWLVKSIELTKDIHKVNISIEPMIEVLKEILEAIENQDNMLIADKLNYEFLPVLEDIHKKIKLTVE
ncbi:MAG: hypothetical protein ACRCW0_07680 [Clostridium sp.]